LTFYNRQIYASKLPLSLSAHKFAKFHNFCKQLTHNNIQQKRNSPPYNSHAKSYQMTL